MSSRRLFKRLAGPLASLVLFSLAACVAPAEEDDSTDGNAALSAASTQKRACEAIAQWGHVPGLAPFQSTDDLPPKVGNAVVKFEMENPALTRTFLARLDPQPTPPPSAYYYYALYSGADEWVVFFDAKGTRLAVGELNQGQWRYRAGKGGALSCGDAGAPLDGGGRDASYDGGPSGYDGGLDEDGGSYDGGSTIEDAGVEDAAF